VSAPAVPAARAPRRRVRGRRVAAPRQPTTRSDNASYDPAILLASEGRVFTPASIELALALAHEADGDVHVLSIARVHGVAFGMPNPGLLPSPPEWDAQRDAVNEAVLRLRRSGVKASGQVMGTRKAASRICDAAQQLGCEAIVMGADPGRARVIGDMLWSQEPQRVQRRAKIAVHLAVEDAPAISG